jgi:tripartite ATP-independent transporter DctM subunit
MEILLLFGVLFGLMAFGVPIFVSMAAAALVTLAVTGLGAATVLPNTMVGGVDSYELLAIPFFVLVGELMNKAGLTQRIIDLMMYFLGRFRGGLAQASVGVNLFASGVSGSAPADAVAVSSVLLPAMKKEGYTPEYAAAVNGSAAVLGPILPPSIPMVFVALVTQLSLGELFLGGVGPAFVMTAAMVALIAWHAVRGKLPAKASTKVAVGGGGSTEAPAEVARPGLGRLILDALPALLAPAFIVAGVFGGFATITEMAILAAFYVLVLGVAYRTLPVREVAALLRDGAVFSSTIMILFAVVGSFTYVIAARRVGDQVAEFVAGLDVGPTTFLLLAMLFFLVVGMVLDAVPAILIFLPILLPVAVGLGVDPIHFGILVVTNLMIGLLTPPVGALLYVMTKVGHVSFGALVKETMPFVAVMLVGLLIMVFVPSITTALPDAVFGR